MSRLRIAIAALIAVIWAFVVIYATLADPAAVALAQLVTPVMLAAVGWLFASEYLHRRFDGKEPDDTS